jgi:hypothetical protein
MSCTNLTNENGISSLKEKRIESLLPDEYLALAIFLSEKI